jgi:hypothetical protein
MPHYVTTNLRFDEPTYRELRYQAGRRRVPLAAIVREAVDRYLGRADDDTRAADTQDPADALIGCVEGSAGDESVNHDFYLYGWPKEGAKGDESETVARHERDGAGPMTPQDPLRSR